MANSVSGRLVKRSKRSDQNIIIFDLLGGGGGGSCLTQYSPPSFSISALNSFRPIGLV
jgi:hypothetical protein